jgi:hypothetical protein
MHGQEAAHAMPGAMGIIHARRPQMLARQRVAALPAVPAGRRRGPERYGL